MSKFILIGAGIACGAFVAMAILIVLIINKSPDNTDLCQLVNGADSPNCVTSVTSAPVSSPIEDNKPEQLSQWYKVVAVVDGDTVKLDINGVTETVRLLGIDTPETKDPRKPVQCFGKEASAETTRLLLSKEVQTESDPSQGERDKYGRLLLYLWVRDDDPMRNSTIFVNDYLVRSGYAFEYTYNLPYKYQSEFKQAQTEAMQNGRGLWAVDTCNGKHG